MLFLLADYIDPIKFDFGKATKILSANIIDTYPVAIKDKTEFTFNNEILKIKTAILNKNYFLTIKVIIAEFKGDIKADALISGVDRIIHKENASGVIRFNNMLYKYIMPIMMGGAIMLLSILNFFEYFRPSPNGAHLLEVFRSVALINATAMLYIILYACMNIFLYFTRKMDNKKYNDEDKYIKD